MRPLIRLRGLEIFVLGGLVFLIGGIWLYGSGYIPGTIRKKADGSYFGTGKAIHRYTNGSIALEEHYRAGKLKRSKWFKPDGSTVAETFWNTGTNVGYYLRDDGTIRVKMSYLGERAHGTAIYYKPDGLTVDHVEEFRDGVKFEPGAKQ